MSENINFCLKFVYEYISNHSLVKFIDSFLVWSKFVFVYRIKNPIIEIFSFFLGGGGGLGPPGPR